MGAMRETRLTHSAQLEGRTIAFDIRRSNRRTVGLTIGEQGLIIALPMGFPLDELQEILQAKARWILTKLDARHARPKAPEIAFGETVDWLGVPHRIVHGPKPVRADGNIICLNASATVPVHVQLARLMYKEAAPFLAQRLHFWANKLGFAPTGFALSNARRQWGVCSSSGSIRLNWRLMQAPPAVVDYVVIHELCHLQELNHSRRFWALVESACPNWRTQRDWLKQHGNRYFFI